MVSPTTEYLNNLKQETNPVPQHAKEEVGDLPRWAKLAMARTIIYGETYAEAVKHFKKKNGESLSKSSLEKLASSPAGKKWRAAILEIADDPVEVSKAMIRASALGVTFDMMWALEQAREAGDYKEVGVIGRNLLDRVGVTEAKLDPRIQAPTIVINVAGDFTLDAPEVVSEHSKRIESAPLTLDAEIVE